MKTSHLFGEENPSDNEKKSELKINGSNKSETRKETSTGNKDSGLKNTSGQSSLEKIDEPIVREKELSDYLLSDEVLADVINDACLNGSKHVPDGYGDGGTIAVPDYVARLKGVDISLKVKGHFDKEKRKKKGLTDGIYILSN